MNNISTNNMQISLLARVLRPLLLAISVISVMPVQALVIKGDVYGGGKSGNVGVEGTPSGSTSVWGAYDANGMKKYFLEDASIINRENEIKMIRAIKNISADEAEKYEIIWYVIKLQHSTGWFGNTEWHIDGVIKEKSKILTLDILKSNVFFYL